MQVSGGPGHAIEFDLNTSKSIGSNEYVLNGIRFVLTEVLPSPRAAFPIPREAYMVTIVLVDNPQTKRLVDRPRPSPQGERA